MVPITDRPPAPSTNDDVQPGNSAGGPLGKRARQRRGRRRFRRVDLDVRAEGLQRHRRAGDQPAAADWRDHGVNVRQVVDDLQADRPVAADEAIVVEGMDELALHPIGLVALDGAPAFLVRHLDDPGAEPLDGAKLGGRRRVHHEHAGRAAGLSRRQGHALGRIPGAHRPDAAGPLRRREVADGVVGAADLERADRLQRFELEIQVSRGFRLQAEARPPPHRSARGACEWRLHTPSRRPRGWFREKSDESLPGRFAKAQSMIVIAVARPSIN